MAISRDRLYMASRPVPVSFLMASTSLSSYWRRSFLASGVKGTSTGWGGMSCALPVSRSPTWAWACSFDHLARRSEIFDLRFSCESWTPISDLTMTNRFRRPEATSPPPIACMNSDGVDMPTSVRLGRFTTFSNFSASADFMVLVA